MAGTGLHGCAPRIQRSAPRWVRSDNSVTQDAPALMSSVALCFFSVYSRCSTHSPRYRDLHIRVGTADNDAVGHHHTRRRCERYARQLRHKLPTYPGTRAGTAPPRGLMPRHQVRAPPPVVTQVPGSSISPTTARESPAAPKSPCAEPSANVRRHLVTNATAKAIARPAPRTGMLSMSH